MSDRLLCIEPKRRKGHPALLPGKQYRCAVTGPIAQGLLADKFSADTRFTDSVRLKWNPDGNQREKFLRELGRVSQLRQFVTAERSMLDLALQFVLANPAVTCPIPGMKSPEQARLNVVAADQELDADTLRKIDEICPPGI